MSRIIMQIYDLLPLEGDTEKDRFAHMVMQIMEQEKFEHPTSEDNLVANIYCNFEIFSMNFVTITKEVFACNDVLEFAKIIAKDIKEHRD